MPAICPCPASLRLEMFPGEHNQHEQQGRVVHYTDAAQGQSLTPLSLADWIAATTSRLMRMALED